MRVALEIAVRIFLAGVVVYLIASLTDLAWRWAQQRSATRRAAEKLLGSWSSLADAQREQINPPSAKRRSDHLTVVRPEREK